MTASKTYSASVPAVTFEQVTGGTRVRREGKGDTLFVTTDDRGADRADVYLIIQHGVGVVGRVGQVDAYEWVLEIGIFRHWEDPELLPLPSSKVRSEFYPSRERALSEAALYWLS
jgi:hypothetical protein